MHAELCIHPHSVKHAEVDIAEGESLISLKVPADKVVKVAEAVKSLLDLAGHKVRRVDPYGDELIDSDEVFAGVTPGMVLRGLRMKEGITQTALAKSLSVSVEMVSAMEEGRSDISLAMAGRIAETFKVPYQMLV